MDLEDERNRIDEINSSIIDDISERMDVVNDIALKKEESDAEVEDSGREEIVKEQFREGFEDNDLPSGKGEELAEYLMSLAKDYQRDRR